MTLTPPSKLAPNDDALGQAGPKDAQGRHVATLAISLVFCPLSIIELILLCESENKTISESCKVLQELFFRSYSYVDPREKFQSQLVRAHREP